MNTYLATSVPAPMAGSRRVAGTVFALLFVAALLTPTTTVVAYHTGPIKAVASEISEMLTLPRNNYSGYTFTLAKGDRIVYDVRVTRGTGIDLYVVSATELGFYRSDSGVRFYWLAAAEAQTVISGVFEADARTAGADTVIVDNVDFSGAQPYGSVNVSVNLTREAAPPPSPWPVVGIVVSVGIGLAILVLLAVRMRKKPASVPAPPYPPTYTVPPPPHVPPSAPPQPPPPGPPPPP